MTKMEDHLILYKFTLKCVELNDQKFVDKI